MIKYKICAGERLQSGSDVLQLLHGAQKVIMIKMVSWASVGHQKALSSLHCNLRSPIRLETDQGHGMPVVP